MLRRHPLIGLLLLVLGFSSSACQSQVLRQNAEIIQLVSFERALLSNENPKLIIHFKRSKKTSRHNMVLIAASVQNVGGEIAFAEGKLGVISHFTVANTPFEEEMAFTLPPNLLKQLIQTNESSFHVYLKMIPVSPEGQLKVSELEIAGIELK